MAFKRLLFPLSYEDIKSESLSNWSKLQTYEMAEPELESHST